MGKIRSREGREALQGRNRKNENVILKHFTLKKHICIYTYVYTHSTCVCGYILIKSFPCKAWGASFPLAFQGSTGGP